MSITALLSEVDWWKFIAIVWPPIVTLIVYLLTQRKQRFGARRGPVLDLLKALNEAEQTVKQFQKKYENGYDEDDDFLADAASVFARCSDFLTKSKDIRTRVLLSKGMLAHVKNARAQLIRELLAVRYGDNTKPFQHGNVYVLEVTKAKDALYKQIRSEV